MPQDPVPTRAPTRSIRELGSAMDLFERSSRMFDPGRLAIFLDYDGTLTPIVAHPEDAILTGEARMILDRLARIIPVSIVTGRNRKDIETLVGLDSLIYAGSHGFDIVGPADCDLHLDAGAEHRQSILALGSLLVEELGDIPNIRIEVKSHAITLHTRALDDQAHDQLDRRLAALTTTLTPFRRTGGKRVIEFRPPVDWDKGHAVRWLVDTISQHHPKLLTPIFIGDDLTDEDALEAVRDDGLGIVVGDDDRPSWAHYRLSDPDAVVAWLHRLTGLLEHRLAIV